MKRIVTEANQRTYRNLAFVLLAGVVFTQTVQAGLPAKYELADLKALERAFVSLADQVRPSVVAIVTYERRGRNGRLKVRYSQGSGFIISADGYIATNRHVIEDADSITVVLHNGLDYEADLVQADPRSDLAVLKIDAGKLVPARLGDGDSVRPNQWVFACGNPFGLANEDGRTSITFGVISALGRQMTQRLVGASETEYYGNMIETSATINPGSSGGPLFDVDGRVIGVVTAIETSSGVSEGHGFAVPFDKNIRRIINMLKDGVEVRYGFLGVQVSDVPRDRTGRVVEMTPYRGALLDAVSVSGGPADRAGLKAKDIVIEYDGTPVQSMDHLVRMVGFTPVGSEASITYLRKGVKRRTVVTVGDRSEMTQRVTKRQ